jgi:serine/threonine protein kinase
MRDESIAGLSKLFDVLQKKKLHQCIGIFQQRARALVFIDNVDIRNVLLKGIFKELDTSSEEMCKLRIKFCKDLRLTGIPEKLHNGTHARIFSAHSNDSEVIVKCYKQTRKEFLSKDADPFLKHFDYERESLSRLKHPNVVTLIAYDEHARCLMLEPVSKGSLLTSLRNHRVSTSIPKLMELLSYAVEIADALEFLENEGIIHLAMQARNVLLHDNGTVKLTGFQFCRTWEQIDKTGVKTAIEKYHFKWMDPQALLFECILPKTVSWSFGVFLYELLTLGCVPFNHPESCPYHGDFKRGPLTSPEARIFVSMPLN